MNRRAFFGAFAALLAAPAAAMATGFRPDVRPVREMVDVSSDWLGECYETPNGETITGTAEFGGKLYVFTRSSVFELRRSRNY